MAYALTLGTVAFLLAVIWGNPLLAILRKYSIGKQIRIDGPSSHQVKMGTPTMGGLMIIVPVVLITVALNIANLFGRTLIGRSILVPIFVMLAFGALGFVDDLAGVRGRKGQGLMARTKFLWQFVIAVPTALVFYFLLDIHSVALPRVPQKIDMGLWYIPVATLLIVGFSNAVNLTDGLDGLAGSTAAVAFVAYGVIANLQGQTWLAAFCFTVTGAIMAFLWFNAYPAQMFMGDVGALALGATLAVVALMTGQWLLLPIIGIVFVAEAMSDILQVAYFKLTGGWRRSITILNCWVGPRRISLSGFG
jgi:phospho-N-acetylmuramoyl-pentapeptide-transferase